MCQLTQEARQARTWVSLHSVSHIAELTPRRPQEDSGTLHRGWGGLEQGKCLDVTQVWDS